MAKTEGPQLRRFKIVGIVGVFLLPFVGVLLTLTTGWTPWITYGVPLIILILITLPLLLSARRESDSSSTVESEAETRNKL